MYSTDFAKILYVIFPSFSIRILHLLVRIAVSPQIAPISFGEEPVNAGDLVSVQCVVTKGDFPLELTWTFEGRPIQSYHGDVIVSDTGKRVKQLIIESVAARHAGEYTCVASNAAGSVSHSAILDVNGTPFDKSMAAIRISVFSHLSSEFIPHLIYPPLRYFPRVSRNLVPILYFYLTSLFFSEFLCIFAFHIYS